MIEYTYPLYRPPAEANNLIIQATYGCSYNNCSFCSMYKNKKYTVRQIKDIYKEIDLLANSYPNTHKIFLADGDALSLPTEYLVKLLKYLQSSFPKLRRVSVYASAQNILDKSQDELELLYNHKLNLIYYGIETGNDELLKKITKGVNQAQIIESLNKASKAKIKISATVILGIGGKNHTIEHIKDTANIINNTTVNYLSTLQLGLDDDIKDKFTMLDDYEILYEQRRFIELINPTNKIIFRSNHASNALHLDGTLPKDKEKLLLTIDEVLKVGESAFIPHNYRGF